MKLKKLKVLRSEYTSFDSYEIKNKLPYSLLQYKKEEKYTGSKYIFSFQEARVRMKIYGNKDCNSKILTKMMRKYFGDL